jgi:hypothetical protein
LHFSANALTCADFCRVFSLAFLCLKGNYKAAPGLLLFTHNWGIRLQSLGRLFVCLFVCFELHGQFFSYLATVTITIDRAAN